MKILMVFDSLSPYSGGSQNAVITWFKNLKKLGVDVKLLTDQNYQKINLGLADSDIIVNRSISLVKKFSGFSFSPVLWHSTIAAILKFNPDIINIQEQLFVSKQTLSFAQKNNYQVLTTMHGDPSKFRSQIFPFSLFIKEGSVFNKLVRNFQFDIFKHSDYLTVPSKFYQDLLLEKLNKNAFVLPSPVSSVYFNKKSPLPKNLSKLITVSRLAGEKHVDVLIEMMRHLRNRFTLTIMGEGMDKEFLIKKVKQLDLESTITFIGWVDKKVLSETIRSHHLFLSASNFETFGLTYIEALASRLPCAVYDYPVSREIIPNNMAIFIKSLDPKVWAEKLLNLQRNQEIYFQLKNNIEKDYKLVYKYNEVESTKKLLKIYEDISSHSRLQ